MTANTDQANPFDALPAQPLQQYFCPGAVYPITRSVHLARLAAFYPQCRECAHRCDTGQLTPATVNRLQSTQRRVERPTLFTAEGIRGIYLNELTRSRAGEIAGSIASLLWERTPRRILMEGEPTTGMGVSRRVGPTVVIGQDERPSSPDILSGVAMALRRCGCQVVDVGIATTACFWYGVHHLQAAAGIYVTGAGCGASWTGLDVVDRGARPVSADASEQDSLTLAQVETRLREGFSRPTRTGGSQRSFQAAIPYEAGLWKHFHALRPLQVGIACSSRLMRQLLTRLFERLPCRLELFDIPVRKRDLRTDDDPDLRTLCNWVGERGADLGMLIDDDGFGCRWIDERGKPVPLTAAVRVLADFVLGESPQQTVIAAEPLADSLQMSIVRHGGTLLPLTPSAARFSSSIEQHQAVFAADEQGRCWFFEAYPTCDAVLTLAKMLQALSRSDARFSDVIGA